jgi:hypothetical protein
MRASSDGTRTSFHQRPPVATADNGYAVAGNGHTARQGVKKLPLQWAKVWVTSKERIVGNTTALDYGKPKERLCIVWGPSFVPGRGSDKAFQGKKIAFVEVPKGTFYMTDELDSKRNIPRKDTHFYLFNLVPALTAEVTPGVFRCKFSLAKFFGLAVFNCFKETEIRVPDILHVQYSYVHYLAGDTKEKRCAVVVSSNTLNQAHYYLIMDVLEPVKGKFVVDERTLQQAGEEIEAIKTRAPKGLKKTTLAAIEVWKRSAIFWPFVKVKVKK